MFKPCIIIPSYNSGVLLETTVQSVLSQTQKPVFVVIDGSNDGSSAPVLSLAEEEPRLQVLVSKENRGKGAAVRTGATMAFGESFTHALVMDADGQHPAEEIETLFAMAYKHPEAMILGQPLFDDSVPMERLYGRKLSEWLVRLETGGSRIGDPLFGFRVYPLRSLLKVMANPRRSNRFDFDPEVAVRLAWSHMPAVKMQVPVKYIDKESGGVSHFHYIRDNLRYVALHTRLLVEAPFQLFLKGKR